MEKKQEQPTRREEINIPEPAPVYGPPTVDDNAIIIPAISGDDTILVDDVMDVYGPCAEVYDVPSIMDVDLIYEPIDDIAITYGPDLNSNPPLFDDTTFVPNNRFLDEDDESTVNDECIDTDKVKKPR